MTWWWRRFSPDLSQGERGKAWGYLWLRGVEANSRERSRAAGKVRCCADSSPELRCCEVADLRAGCRRPGEQEEETEASADAPRHGGEKERDGRARGSLRRPELEFFAGSNGGSGARFRRPGRLLWVVKWGERARGAGASYRRARAVDLMAVTPGLKTVFHGVDGH